MTFPSPENGGGFLLTKQNQFAIIYGERTGFSARPDLNQGGLSVSGLKKLLSVLEAIFVCQEQKWHFEGKMGNITIDERRVQKMQQRLGKATKLITDDRYLPMFRNRQINYAREFDYSIKLAKRKRNPRKYFAFIWSSANLAKTVDWLRKLIAQAKAKAAEERHKQKMQEQAALPLNITGLEKLAQMKRSYNLIT